MDGKKRQAVLADGPTTMILLVCTRCVSLRKEELGKAATTCECGGRRRIVRFIRG